MSWLNWVDISLIHQSVEYHIIVMSFQITGNFMACSGSFMQQQQNLKLHITVAGSPHEEPVIFMISVGGIGANHNYIFLSFFFFQTTENIWPSCVGAALFLRCVFMCYWNISSILNSILRDYQPLFFKKHTFANSVFLHTEAGTGKWGLYYEWQGHGYPVRSVIWL